MAEILLSTNNSFGKLDIEKQANIQNAGLTGKKFTNALNKTGSLRETGKTKTNGSHHPWVNGNGKMLPHAQ